MKKFVKLAAVFLMLSVVMASASGCLLLWLLEDEEDSAEQYPSAAPATAINSSVDFSPYGEEDTWAIYWYLCGSDLETDYGSATIDLAEMMEVDLPENVFVVIQTGGANEWQNGLVDANKLCRYLYSSDGLSLVDQQNDADMGNKNTLASFLKFCTDNYPADHQAVIFWDHGSGSVDGVIFDERHGFNSLSLNDIREAFASVCEIDESNPPFELVGFDACLMATVDTAAALSGITRYMAASEETEPALGWSYDGFLSELAANPRLNGAGLGKAIADSYYDACKEEDAHADTTLSVVDITRIQPLLSAYHNINVEALAAACNDTTFFSSYRRNAKAAENYGGNDSFQGYTNMVDLGDLVRNTSHLLPDSGQEVLNALEYCVVYMKNGPYRAQASGLACFHSFNYDWDNLIDYKKIAAIESSAYLYEYGITGEMTEDIADYVSTMAYEKVVYDSISHTPSQLQNIPDPESIPLVPSISDLDLEDYPVYVDEDGYAVLDIGAEAASMLSGVYFYLSYYDYSDDSIVFLGRDNDIFTDWENGIFYDNFRGYWGAIDGCLTYMELTYEGEDYNLYSVPILLNGDEYSLRVCYDYELGEYIILGARLGLYENGMSDRNLRQLQPGDEITTILYMMYLDEDDDLYQFEAETLTVSSDTAFEEADLGDGEFILMFEMVDAYNNSMLSDVVFIEVVDDIIYFTENE